MQCHILPVRTTQNINKLIRNFIWGSTIEKRKIHSVNWATITKFKNQGGIQICDTKFQNLSLISGLAWRFLMDTHNPPWKALVSVKYMSDTTLHPFTLPHHRKSDSFIWKNILVGWSICTKLTRWMVGDGTSIRFWLDPWITSLSQPLIETLQGPFNQNDHKLMVSSIITNDSYNLAAIPYPLPTTISAKIRDTPLSSRLNLLAYPDTIYWTASTNSNFSTSFCYKALLNIPNTKGENPNLNWIWKPKVPNKIKTFLWLCW